MTTKQISLLIVTLAIGVTCFARTYVWPIPTKPTLNLGQAEAIGDKTIEQKFTGFFCIRASYTRLGETDQEWDLTYTNTKGEQQLVIVDAKGNGRIHEGPRNL